MIKFPVLRKKQILNSMEERLAQARTSTPQQRCTQAYANEPESWRDSRILNPGWVSFKRQPDERDGTGQRLFYCEG